MPHDAARNKSWLRFHRIAAYSLLICVLVVAGAYGWRTLGQLRNGISDASGIEIESSDPQLFVLEYQRLRTSLARYVAGDPVVDHDTVVMLFDILWGRCETMQQGSFYGVLRDTIEVHNIARDILVVLHETEDAVFELERDDRETAHVILAKLEPFDRRFTEYLIEFAGHRFGWMQEYRAGLARMVEKIDTLGPAILAPALALLTLLVFEARQARRAEAFVREREEESRYLACHDSLTGLANRVYLNRKLGEVLAAATRSGSDVALFALDLDGFKRVNDTFGHEMGDRLLGVVARRLSGLLGPNGLVARLGGDEFAILMPDSANRERENVLALRIIASLEQPVMLDGRDLHVSTSIGIARFPQDADNVAELLGHADVALYAAKGEGKRTFCRFDRSMGEKIVRQKLVERGLRAALAADALEVHYQPQIRVADNVIIGVEALCRWRDPELGNVPPDEFIAVAEETGLILDVGRWVLAEVASTMASWPEALAGLEVAVNFSPVQFLFQDVCADLLEVADTHGLDLRRITLEITEGAMMRDTERTMDQLRNLREHGVDVAIDDFGKGYSSLSYLRKFPLNQLKIDRSFVQGIERDAEARAVIRGILGLASSLGLETVAEGVEDLAQLAFLRDERCTVAQGYLFSRPVPNEQLLDLIDCANKVPDGAAMVGSGI